MLDVESLNLVLMSYLISCLLETHLSVRSSNLIDWHKVYLIVYRILLEFSIMVRKCLQETDIKRFCVVFWMAEHPSFSIDCLDIVLGVLTLP